MSTDTLTTTSRTRWAVGMALAPVTPLVAYGSSSVEGLVLLNHFYLKAGLGMGLITTLAVLAPFVTTAMWPYLPAALAVATWWLLGNALLTKWILTPWKKRRG